MYYKQGYFRPIQFSPIYTGKKFRPILNLPRNSFVLIKRDDWPEDIKICPVINFPTDDNENHRTNNIYGHIQMLYNTGLSDRCTIKYVSITEL